MTLELNWDAPSLDTLARTAPEKAFDKLSLLTVDLATGDIVDYRYSFDEGGGISTRPGLLMQGNLFDHTEGQWQYMVGTENVPLLLALRDALLAGDYSGGYVEINKQGVSVYAYDQTGLPDQTATLNVAMEAVYGASVVDPSADQVVYGDAEYLTRGFSSTPFYNDVLYGADGNDSLIGLLGDDKLSGGLGADTLYGGYGFDTLQGGDGADTLYGEQNNDSLYGGAGDDYLDGGLGADYMTGGDGNDTYVVDNVGDVVDDKGAPGEVNTVLIPEYLSYLLPDNIDDGQVTGDADASITGNKGANALTGGGGDNYLDGAGGKDRLYGADGDDTLRGGPGRDVLAGGAGFDTFVFGPGETQHGSARDVIVDFARGLDIIDLSEIDADTTISGDQAFTLVKQFSHTPGEMTFHHGILSCDTDGDGRANFEISVLAVPTLSAADFTL